MDSWNLLLGLFVLEAAIAGKYVVFKINTRAWSGREVIYFIQHSMGVGEWLRPGPVYCPVMFWVLIVAETGAVFCTWRTASPTSVLPACTWKMPEALSRGCNTACHLSALRFRPEDHHWPISYTGWPISPGVQSLFLSSTIWNRLWCRGKSTSLRASWCVASSSLSFPTQAEKEDHSFLTSLMHVHVVAEVRDNLMGFYN